MFSERLKRLRLRYELYQSELGEKLGIATSTISMYENGQRSPDIEMLIKISKLFNVSTDYLLGLTNDYNNNVFDRSIIKSVAMRKEYSIETISEREKNIIKKIVLDILDEQKANE